jgi:dTDP-glucose pyrophosphorylase
MKALILAGGLGSRLKTYTNVIYPKILLSLGNETMLDKLIFTWFGVNNVDEMLIVLSEESHLNMVQKYLNVFHPEKPVKLCLYPKTDGTFNTIFYVLIYTLKSY